MCPRKALDEDTVLYLKTDIERMKYIIYVDNNGQFLDSYYTEPQPQLSHNITSSSGSLLNTGPEGWIFVIRGQHIFANVKRTKTFPRYVYSTVPYQIKSLIILFYVFSSI